MSVQAICTTRRESNPPKLEQIRKLLEEFKQIHLIDSLAFYHFTRVILKNWEELRVELVIKTLTKLKKKKNNMLDKKSKHYYSTIFISHEYYLHSNNKQWITNGTKIIIKPYWKGKRKKYVVWNLERVMKDIQSFIFHIGKLMVMKLKN